MSRPTAAAAAAAATIRGSFRWADYTGRQKLEATAQRLCTKGQQPAVEGGRTTHPVARRSDDEIAVRYSMYDYKTETIYCNFFSVLYGMVVSSSTVAHNRVAGCK